MNNAYLNYENKLYCWAIHIFSLFICFLFNTMFPELALIKWGMVWMEVCGVICLFNVNDAEEICIYTCFFPPQDKY